MRNQLRRKTSGLGRLLSKMRKRNNSLQHRDGESCKSNGHLEKRVEVSVPEADTYSTHFSYRRGEQNVAESNDTVRLLNGQVVDIRDFSDEILDDDAIELNTTDPHLMVNLTEEGRPRFEGIKTLLTNTDATSRTTADTSEKVHCSSVTHANQLSCSYPYCTIPFDAPARLSLHALDAYNSDPVPYFSVSHEVIYMAIQQLETFDLTNLNGQRCLQQHFRGLRTLRYDMGVNSDKFACEGCSMTPGRVCIRWLGENAFVILPLVPKFRDQLVGSTEVGYWVWDGH